MLEVAEASAKVREQFQPVPTERVPLLSALGRVLAEPITSDLDMPPFDKALMDGYAVRSADVASSGVTLAVVEDITAGQTPKRPLGPGQASRIMTGAPLPEGCDAVVPVERTRPVDDRRAEILNAARPGDNILRRGREMRRGEVVIAAGTPIRPQHVGILAAVGRESVEVHPAPRVAVLATGDELVEGAALPGPGQIRNSNAPMLLAQAARAGGQPRSLGIARDRLDSLRPLVEEGLRTSEILVLSGGVSAGKLDLVPEVLRDAGVTPHFHKIAMKPGKPLFFGTCDRPEGRRYVFGLPGNPVSSFVCFELFLRPLIRWLAGFPAFELPDVSALLVEDFQYETDRPTFYPAFLSNMPGYWGSLVQPLPWFGSADLRALLDANALLVIHGGRHSWPKRHMVRALRLDW
jgi:molybdopterin molybdotransferase